MSGPPNRFLAEPVPRDMLGANQRLLPAAVVLVALCGLDALLPMTAGAGTETSGLFVEFTATRNQEALPESLATKQMCPDRPGTHTFAPDLRVEDRNENPITSTFVGFEFTMTLTRSGSQATLVKPARFRVSRTGTRPVAGGASLINFFLQPGDCVGLTMTPETDLFLLSGEVLTASLFLTKEPAATGGPPPPGPEPLASCTISFDGACPNAGAQCGADFSGGNGCVTISVGSCYSSGAFSYENDPGETVSIDLAGGLNSLDVFFAARGGGTGTMRFFDGEGAEVGSALRTNGDCTSAMPPTQSVDFARPVRSIEVTTTGSPSFIDTFAVNPR
jgi:hypothetical protein